MSRAGAATILALALLPALARAGGAEERRIAAAVAQAMKQWSVPGVAVVVVRDDRIVYLAGHGVREAGKKGAVTPDTLFPLGSCSKAFTSAAMAVLADEKKLRFDDRVSKHLGWFHLSDPLADREVRLRDLLCHRTGLASHDALWFRAPWKPEETVRRAGKLPLARPFRSAWQYQSTMWTAAGLAASSAAGSSWPELVQSRLLGPLGMKSTRLSTADALKSADLATGHHLDRTGEPAVMARYAMEADPAGSVHSSARDLGQWLRFHLAVGAVDGKRIVSAEALGETHAPQMVMRVPAIQSGLFPDTVQISYGMGWVVHDHHGVGLVAHGGAIDGFRAQITLAPGKKLGLAVLSNLHQTPMNMALSSTLVDLLLDLPKRDWHALHRATLARMAEAAAERQKEHQATRKHGTRPSRELAAYAGTYEHPAYGTARIELKNGGLVWRWRDDEAPLAHRHYDTFTLRADLAGDADVTFALDRTGAVKRFTVTGNLNIDFRRVAGKTEKR
jgi:CubicO group peptidase (beta-lactamase class C family)